MNWRHIPEEILENENCAEDIRKNGFKVSFNTRMDYKCMYKFFKETVLVKEVELIQVQDNEKCIEKHNEECTKEEIKTIVKKGDKESEKRERNLEIQENLIEENSELEEDTLKNRYLTFLIENETYGVEIRYVIEIIGIQTITEIPGIPEYVKGIINLRGSIIPVMDVRLRFRKDPLEYNDRTCVIIVEINGDYIGLIVDKVLEVLMITDKDIVEPPKMKNGSNNRYI